MKEFKIFFPFLIIGIFLIVNTSFYQTIILTIYTIFFILFLLKNLKSGTYFILFALIPYSAFLWRLNFVFGDRIGTKNILLFFPDILFFILIIYFILNIIVNKVNIHTTPISKLLFIFIIYCAIQILNPSTNLYSGISGFRFVLFLLMFYIGVFINLEYKDIIKLFNSIIALSLILAGYAIIQNIFGLPFFEKKWLNEFWMTSNQLNFNNIYQQGSYFFGKTIRAYSFTEQGPYLAQFLGFGISLSLVGYFYQKYKIKKLLYFAMIVFFFYAILITYSRGGIIVVSLTFLTILLIRKSKINFKIIIYIIAILVIFNLVVSPYILKNITPSSAGEFGLLEIMNPSEAGSLVSRFFFWDFIVKNIILNPIGYGAGTAGTAAIGHSPILDVITDNQYLWITLQYGIIGLILYLLIIFKIFKTLLFAYNRTKITENKNLVLSMLGCSIVYFSYGLVADNIEHRLPTYFYWFLLGVTFRFILCSERNREDIYRT